MTVHEFADLLEDLINENGYESVKKTILELLDFYKKKENINTIDKMVKEREEN